MRPKTWGVIGGCVGYSLVSYLGARFAPDTGTWLWKCLPLLWITGWLGLWLLLPKTGQREKPMNEKVFFALVFVYVCFALGLVWSLHFPAETTADIVYQWEQTHGVISYSDVHAIGHTFVLKIIYSLWDRFEAVVLVQLLGIALLYAAFGVLLRRRGMRETWFLVLLAPFTSCLSYADIYVAVLKDTPYTLCVGLVTLLMMVYAEKRRSFRGWQGALLGVALAGCGLMRQNGLVVMAVCGLYCLGSMARERTWKALGLMAVALVMSFGMVEIGSAYVQAKHLDNGFSVAPFAKGIAAVVAEGGVISPEQQAELNEIFTPEEIQWMKEQYHPWDKSNRMLWYREYRQEPKPAVFENRDLEVFNNRYVLALGANRHLVIRLYFSLLPQNIGLYLKDLAYNTHVIWGIYGERPFFSNAWLCGLLVVAVALWWRKKTWKRRWAVFLPVLCNICSIAVSTVTNEPRYLLPTFALFPVLLLFVLITRTPTQLKTEE